MHVGADDVAAVHVRVGLDRLHELGHALGRLDAARTRARARSATRPPRPAPSSSPARRSPARGRPSPRPARPSRAARRTSRRARCRASSSSVEHRVLGVGGVDRVHRLARHAAARAPPAAAGAASRRRRARSRLSTNACSAWLMTSTALTRSHAARRAAAAGLLSSCASPAAIVPSEVSRSRLASRALTPRITGPITRITWRWTERCVSARSTNASRGTIAIRHGPSAVEVDRQRALGQRRDRADPGRPVVRRRRLDPPVDVLAWRRTCRRTAAAARARARPARAAPRRPRRRAAARRPPTPRAPRRSARRTGRPAAGRR